MFLLLFQFESPIKENATAIRNLVKTRFNEWLAIYRAQTHGSIIIEMKAFLAHGSNLSANR